MTRLGKICGSPSTCGSPQSAALPNLWQEFHFVHPPNLWQEFHFVHPPNLWQEFHFVHWTSGAPSNEQNGIPATRGMNKVEFLPQVGAGGEVQLVSKVVE